MINYPIRIIIASAVIIATLLCAAACAPGGDAANFKREHEILNGQTTPDGEHTYKSVDIPANNKFKYTDGEGAISLLASGSGILYMGFPECPWCRTLLPTLIEAAGESGYKGDIHYYNGLDDRNVMSLDDDGNIVAEKEGERAYLDLVDLLYDYLTPYRGLNDDSLKRIYFPTTVFYKDGAVSSVHLVTIDSQESGYDALTDQQYAELKDVLIGKINAIK